MLRALARISTVAVVVLASSPVGVVQQQAPSAPQPPMPRARYDRMMKEVSTPPFELKMFIVPDNSASMPRISDRVEMDFHGGAYTHLDALCHIACDHHTYNGYVLKDTVTTTGGCSKNSVINMKDGIVTRAVLIDMPRLRGVAYLQPGTRVTRADVEAWETRVNVRIGAGDAVLLRTGRWARPDGAGAGWDLWALPLLKERDIAVVGSDGAQEVADNLEPPTLESEQRLRVAPVHKVIGTMMGLAILDNLDLDQAAETAARLNRWEFMIVVSPLRVPNGTGSPVNPIGMF